MATTFSGTYGAGSGLYNRVMDPNRLGTYLNLEQAELLRIKRYDENWRFYLGFHWNFQREGGDPLVTLNYSKKIVDKHVYWLIGEGVTVKVNDVLKNKTLPVIKEVWEYNNGQQWLFDGATVGGVTGDMFALITYAEPTVQAKRINPQTKGMIRIQLLNSEQVFPQWDPTNIGVLQSVRIETLYYDQHVGDQGNNPANGELNIKRFTQIITATEIFEQLQGSDAVKKPNLFGEIALVHIPNISTPGEYYGRSDLDGVIDLNREMNEKSTDISDVINYHAFPIITVTGAKLGAIDRSPKSVWSGLPEGSQVQYLNNPMNLQASNDYLKFIKQSLCEIGDVPEAAFGATQPISNTSGVALNSQFQPLIEHRARKLATHKPAFEKINYFILRMKELTDPSFVLPFNLCKNCGGKIVDFGDRKRCFMNDPNTLDFMAPEDVPIKYVREYTFGKKIEEAPFKQVKKEAGQTGASFWDVGPPKPEPEPMVDYMGNPLPAPPEAPVPMGSIEMPPEPEEVAFRTVDVDPIDGRTVGETLEKRMLVWTRCTRPEFLNPYSTEVSFNTTTPKDSAASFDLHSKMLDKKIVSKRWVRKHTPEIEDPEQMERDIQDEQADHPEDNAPPPGKGQEDPYLRTVGAPFASNVPEEAT